MRRPVVSLLFVVFVMATFWAYTVADTLIREFGKDITFIDLGAIFVLGLIAGGALALAIGRKWPVAN
jgi:hypothetical protein